jgi:hypothetical protein
MKLIAFLAFCLLVCGVYADVPSMPHVIYGTVDGIISNGTPVKVIGEGVLYNEFNPIETIDNKFGGSLVSDKKIFIQGNVTNGSNLTIIIGDSPAQIKRGSIWVNYFVFQSGAVEEMTIRIAPKIIPTASPTPTAYSGGHSGGIGSSSHPTTQPTGNPTSTQTPSDPNVTSTTTTSPTIVQTSKTTPRTTQITVVPTTSVQQTLNITTDEDSDNGIPFIVYIIIAIVLGIILIIYVIYRRNQDEEEDDEIYE